MNDLAPLEPTLALVRLLQLASPALPIGAYSYSQGLEWVVAAGGARDAAAAQVWIGDALARSIADEDVSSFAPGLALASSRHETQYTRLFRS